VNILTEIIIWETKTPANDLAPDAQITMQKQKKYEKQGNMIPQNSAITQ
jgi:hypothetical protein